MESSGSQNSVAVGDTLYIGKYEQNGNSFDGLESVQWFVLALESGRALVITTDSIDNQCYDSKNSTSWEKSSLRNWLNFSLFNQLFTSEEKKNILESECVQSSPDGDVSVTQDKLFVLSVEEFDQYMPEEMKACHAADSAKNHGAYCDSSGNCWYWLRSLGKDARHVCAVKSDASVSDSLAPTSKDTAVRPAMWISIQ